MFKALYRSGIIFISGLMAVLACNTSRAGVFEVAQSLIDFMLSSEHPGFQVKNNAVYYKSCNAGDGCHLIKLNGANPETFTVFEKYGYAKDNKRVYFRQDIVEGANPASFKVVKGLGAWAIDKNHVYSYGNLVKNADPSTFRIIKTPPGFYDLGADKYHIILEDVANPACDPGTLYQLNTSISWQADSQCMYYEGKLVKGADPHTFKIIEGVGGASVYAKDRRRVYYMGRPIVGANPKSFVSMDYDFSKDKQHVYFFGKLLKGADAKSFKFISDDYDDRTYQQDDRHVYYRGQVLSGVLPSGFKILKNGQPFPPYTEFQNRIYVNGKPMPGVSAKDFQVLAFGYAKTSQHVYLNGTIVKSIKDPKTFKIMRGGECMRDKYYFYNTETAARLKGDGAQECARWFKAEKNKRPLTNREIGAIAV